jgi:tRNA A37 methylthiotransferase MiaB
MRSIIISSNFSSFLITGVDDRTVILLILSTCILSTKTNNNGVRAMVRLNEGAEIDHNIGLIIGCVNSHLGGNMISSPSD